MKQSLEQQYTNNNPYFQIKDIEKKGAKLTFFQIVLFNWASPIFNELRYKTLEQNDIVNIDEANQIDLTRTEYKDELINAYQYYKENNRKYSFLRAMLYTYRYKAVNILMLSLLSSIMMFSAPKSISITVSYIKNAANVDLSYMVILEFAGLILAVALVNIIRVLTISHMRMYQSRVGIAIYDNINQIIFEKGMRINMQFKNEGEKDMNQGFLVNLLQYDSYKASYSMEYTTSFFYIPLQIVISIYILYSVIGKYFVIGFLVILIQIFVNVLIGKLLSRTQKNLLNAKDERVKQTEEIVENLKSIKLNNYSAKFSDKLGKVRNKELWCLIKYQFATILMILNLYISQPLTVGIVLWIYSSQNPQLKVEDLYSLIYILGLISMPIKILGVNVMNLAQCKNCIERIETFLDRKEINQNYLHYVNNDKTNVAFDIREASFGWFDNQFVLQHLNLSFKKNMKIMIKGKVGCGKTTLMQALVGEAIQKQNKKSVIQSKLTKVSLYEQKAWAFNGSILQNIVNDPKIVRLEQLDQDKQINLVKSIKYSCLFDDLKSFNQNIYTEIGIQGQNLSGGQKARINISRSIYNYLENKNQSDNNILMLDDPLSALDNNVGKEVINNIIMADDFQQSTIIFSTSNNMYYEWFDQIYTIKDGTIQLTQANIKDEYNAITNLNFDFQQILKEFKQQLTDQKFRKQMQFEEEQMTMDNYEKFSLYILKGCFIYLMILLSTVACVSRLGADKVIQQWTQDSENNYQYYLLNYGILNLIFMLFCFLRMFSNVIYHKQKGKRMFNDIMDNLYHAEIIEFVDKVPSARIINRLTRDLQHLEQNMVYDIGGLFQQIFKVLATLVVSVYTTNYYMFIIIAIYLLMIKSLCEIYLPKYQQMNLLTSVARTPIIQFFKTSVKGSSIIRSQKKQGVFVEQFQVYNKNNRMNQIVQTGMSYWFNIRISLISSLFIFCVMVLCFVVQTQNQESNLYIQSMVGFVLTYTLTLDPDMIITVSLFSQLQGRLVSFERLLNYTKLQKEKGYQNVDQFDVSIQLKEFQNDLIDYSKDCENVVIEMENVYCKYQKNFKTVLSNLNVRIKKNQKIGIIGRTGSGKSTIFQMMMRVLDPYQGKISINGQDIQTMELEKLRKRICYISQDSAIFKGSIRENLDVLEELSDYQIIQRLDIMRQLPLFQNLEQQVQEGGNNLSQGERQLICVARALMRDTSIVLMDEATANIDYKQDIKIQSMIQEVFKNKTVITIAHRINNIIESDQIIVLKEGQIVEQGKYQELIDNQRVFYELYQKQVENQANISNSIVQSNKYD